MILQLLRLNCDCCLVPMITVVIGKIIHGVLYLGGLTIQEVGGIMMMVFLYMEL